MSCLEWNWAIAVHLDAWLYEILETRQSPNLSSLNVVFWVIVPVKNIENYSTFQINLFGNYYLEPWSS